MSDFAPKPAHCPHTSVIPSCVHDKLLSLSTCPQPLVSSQSIVYSHVFSPVTCFHRLLTACCMTGVCVCVYFTCPLSHTLLPEWPWASSPHWECCSYHVLSCIFLSADGGWGRKQEDQAAERRSVWGRQAQKGGENSEVGQITQYAFMSF